jgi:hypothetical protein
MIIIIGGLLLFGMAFLGIGLLFVKAESDQALNFDGAFRRFWLGVSVTIAFLQIWHLFFPVTLVCQIIVILAGLAGYIRSRSGILRTIKNFTWLKVLSSFGAGFVLAIMIGLFSVDGNLHYDHGLYHIQTVKWIESYAIVPGLGNVHHRLAFNSSSFLFTALLNQGIFHGYAFYIHNSLLAWVLCLKMVQSMLNLLASKGKLSKQNLFYALTFPLFLWYLPNFYFAGYSNDLFVSVLQVLLAGEFIAFLEIKENGKRLKRQATLLIVFSVLMVCLKLSGLVYAAAFLITTFVIMISRCKNEKGVSTYFLGQFGILFTFGLVWLFRSVILSGYLIYPSALISFNVPWKIPSEMVEVIPKVIYNWSRYGFTISPDTPFLKWLPMWFSRVPRGLKEGWILGVMIAVLTTVLFVRKRISFKLYAGQFQIIIFSILNILYWFLMAPEIRFVGMTYWIAFAALLSILVESFTNLKPKISKNALVLFVLILNLVWLSPSIPRGIGILEMIVKPPIEYKIAGQFVDHENLLTRTTKSGLEVYLPNGKNKQTCWDLPLPCLPEADFYSKLALINPDNIQEGFKIIKEVEQ